MILELLIVCMILGAGASWAAMIRKEAALYTGLASLTLWLVVAYGATSIDLVADDGTLSEAAAAEPALVALGFAQAGLSALVVVAAATGAYDEIADGADGPSVPETPAGGDWRQ